MDLTNETMDDPDFAPLPAGPKEAAEVEAAIRTALHLGAVKQADRYYDRVRNMIDPGAQKRIVRAIQGFKEVLRG